MSTGYSWEGIRQVPATLLGARHVPERLCGGYVYLGRYIKCSTFTFLTFSLHVIFSKIHNLCTCTTIEPMASCWWNNSPTGM